MKILLLIAGVLLVLFLFITSVAPFRNSLFAGLFPKDFSKASENPPITYPEVSPTPNSTVKQISIINSSFVPNNIVANVGDTITWTNNDSIPHTVTADINSAFGSGTLQPGQTFSISIGLPGVFGYHCNFHSLMTGTVTGISNSPQPSIAQKPGDIDQDEDVDIFDYNHLLTDFGKTGSNIPADLDGDDIVGIFDYNLLLTNFGK